MGETSLWSAAMRKSMEL